MSMVEISKDCLEHEYCILGKTFQEIALKIGCDKTTVSNRAKEYGIESRVSGRRRANVVLGQKYGMLTVLDVITAKGNKHLSYRCQCDCGKETKRMANSLLSGKPQMCWTCRGAFISRLKWKGFGEISGEFWAKTIRSATVRNYNFEITIEQGWELFLKQNRKCALSGVELIFSQKRQHRGETTASVDRIDSSGHYTLNNVQWLHKVVNNLKMDLPEQEFLEWCRLITENRSKL